MKSNIYQAEESNKNVSERETFYMTKESQDERGAGVKKTERISRNGNMENSREIRL